MQLLRRYRIVYKLENCLWRISWLNRSVTIKMIFALLIYENLSLLCVHNLAISATSTIVVLSILVTHLSARLSPSILASLNKASVPVNTYNTIVESRSIHITHASFTVSSRVVFDKAKAAGSLQNRVDINSGNFYNHFCAFSHLLELIESHHDSSHIAAAAKQLKDLLLAKIECKLSVEFSQIKKRKNRFVYVV